MCKSDTKARAEIHLAAAAHVLMLCVFQTCMVFWQGGAIGIVVDWTCNFDVDIKHCKPVYNFHGLYGNPGETDQTRASVGYNFRCVNTLKSQLQLHIIVRIVVYECVEGCSLCCIIYSIIHKDISVF